MKGLLIVGAGGFARETAQAARAAAGHVAQPLAAEIPGGAEHGQTPIHLRSAGMTFASGRSVSMLISADATVPLWMLVGGPFEEDQR